MMKPDELLKLLRSYKFECCGVDYSAEAAKVVKQLIDVKKAANEVMSDYFRKFGYVEPKSVPLKRLFRALVALDGDDHVLAKKGDGGRD